MRVKWKLFVALLKMLSRQREAVLWSLLLPLFMILLFSFVRFDGIGKVRMGVVNAAGSTGAEAVQRLRAVQTLSVETGEKESELDLLRKGDRDVVLVIPAGFAAGATQEVMLYTNEAKPGESQIGALVVQQVLDDLVFERNHVHGRITVRQELIASRNLSYFDFVAPGILSMSIMQLGIFGVAFGFVSLKKRGILRRLFVTPVNRADFIIASVATRLVLVVLQILIMTLVPFFFLDLHFVGSFLDLFLVGTLGAMIFIAFGFVIAGIGKSEDQVAPLANIIALPMMILSGVFFSRDTLPGFLRAVTDFFPLSFLADAMRMIAIDGASLGDLGWQLLGLSVWCILAIVLAVKVFRWE